MTVKIHISRDFSFCEFEVEANIATGEGLPTAEQLCKIFDRLPSKDTQPLGPTGLREQPSSAKRTAARASRPEQAELPATPNQRRVLERYGEWVEGMTRPQASQALKELGF